MNRIQELYAQGTAPGQEMPALAGHAFIELVRLAEMQRLEIDRLNSLIEPTQEED